MEQICKSSGCKNGKHLWEGKNFAQYNRNSKKYFYYDWDCQKCNVKIFGSSPQCKTCGQKRPHKLDWYCQSHDDTTICNYLNHSLRTECRKCNNEKNKRV